MSKNNWEAIVLAAGKGVRMKSHLPKVLHRLCGISLVEHVLRAAAALCPSKILLVVGEGEELVQKELELIRKKPLFQTIQLITVRQEKQLGTGDAVLCAIPLLNKDSSHLVILPGDMPLMSFDTLLRAKEQFEQGKIDLTIISAIVDNPQGFGRLIRDDSRQLIKIVEDKDCTPQEKNINEINSSVYFSSRSFIEESLTKALNTNNAQNEFYLPDIVNYGHTTGKTIRTFTATDPTEILGCNTRQELAMLTELRRKKLLLRLLEDGVTIEDPKSVYIDEDVQVGPDCYIGPGTRLHGTTRLSEKVVIEGQSIITDSIIESGSIINFCCALESSHIGPDCQIGPFAHLRAGSNLTAAVKIGNFCETKKVTLSPGVKANHLSYLGDTTIEKDVNIGAGTITCNYDGINKHPTYIEEGVSIGSNTNLVAPVRIGARAIIGAGSTITRDVPADALALERSKQENHEGSAARKWAKLREGKNRER